MKKAVNSSKSRPTIEHLYIACRHVDELMAANVTENLAKGALTDDTMDALVNQFGS
jgi:hypothetical protein